MHRDGDIDGDHDVDTMDQILLLSDWGGACPGGSNENDVSLVYRATDGNVRLRQTNPESGCLEQESLRSRLKIATEY